ncbi:MAG: hypothetical protein RL684_3142 [Pseudomonadota bacterium]
MLLGLRGVRDSPADHVATALLADGIDVIAVKPNISGRTHRRRVVLGVASRFADLLAVLVKHRQFVREPATNALEQRQAIDFGGVLA